MSRSTEALLVDLREWAARAHGGEQTLLREAIEKIEELERDYENLRGDYLDASDRAYGD